MHGVIRVYPQIHMPVVDNPIARRGPATIAELPNCEHTPAVAAPLRGGGGQRLLEEGDELFQEAAAGVEAGEAGGVGGAYAL